MKQFIQPSKLSLGDQVAVLSPSAGLPGVFPWVQDLGLSRLQDAFQLKPKEYPTTRTMNASLEDRARDLMVAFADPANKAILTSIGGNDQIQLIKYLDPAVFQNNPKPFFGYSDNTHLHNFLWNLGIPSFYGSSIMCEFATQGEMPRITVDSLKHALFEAGEYQVPVAKTYSDIGLDWADKSNLTKTRYFEPNDGFYWDGEADAEGILWGGCVESLIVQVATHKYLPATEDLEGTVLYLETAEDIPEHWIVEYLLTGFGERGWLEQFQAILVGRPKAWEFDKQLIAEQKADYRQAQRDTIVKTVRRYNSGIPIIQNLDFGHTAPQVILPSGGRARVDTKARKIYLTY